MNTVDPLEGFTADSVLKHLHGFQRDAAEHAFDRLWKSPDSTKRFLIADEVGLGKTIIAKGVLAKALEYLKNTVPRIDVIYICSNLAIARQNIDRLNPLAKYEFSDAERITLLPVHLHHLSKSRVNFVAFTPGTSLDLKTTTGVSRERMLLHTLLAEHWGLEGSAPYNVLQGGVVNAESWRSQVTEFARTTPISEELRSAFLQSVDANSSLRERFGSLCELFHYARKSIPYEENRERNRVVGELRALLARSCIGALEPDLVILDEFQRFRDLLNEESEIGELAKHLFDWSDNASAAARVLLLSATPYKAYTLTHESDEDDHYEDFLRTVRFLDNSAERTSNLRTLLAKHRRELLAITNNGGQNLLNLKNGIEAHLRRIMSRTERLAVAGVKNGMLKSVVETSMTVWPQDLASYVGVSRYAELVGGQDGIEYWKSAAYPISFMDGYDLKTKLTDRIRINPSEAGLVSAAAAAETSCLSGRNIATYQPVEPPNPRVRRLISELDETGAFDTLWLPPSLPYYHPEGRFAAVSPGLSKFLIFSAWHVVPRSIAGLLTYEAERRAFCSDEDNPLNNEEARKNRRGLLRVSRTEGRLAGLPVFSLLYPSRFLAETCDVRILLRESGGALPTLAEALEWARSRLETSLRKLVGLNPNSGNPDEAWYWAAPILLDKLHFPSESEAWWSVKGLAGQWAGVITAMDADDDETDQGWKDHVIEANSVITGSRALSGPPPADLLNILALIGIAGPATVALRGLLRLFPAEGAQDADQRTAAARFGWGFRTLFNRPEAMALIRSGKRDRDHPYWLQCLEFSASGCVSAVVDEYLHVLRDQRGLTARPREEGCSKMAEAAIDALSLRPAKVAADEIRISDDHKSVEQREVNMRGLFAVRYGSDKTEDAKQVQRDTSVSAAFNSPFWPFVLATTSVGQEGLDFHWYCHRVMHWNLPSNPVDMEQREGRVHRFKGHAVRKNVARVHGAAALRAFNPDIWEVLFSLAEEAGERNSRGLVPYWLYPLEDGAWIERRIALFPLSKDEGRLEALRRSLGAYRMVFGQPRQDELLAYLLNKMSKEDLEKYSDLLRIDLAPPSSRRN